MLGRRGGAGGAGRRAAAGRGRAGGQAAVRRETAAHRQERRTGSGRLHLAGVDVVRVDGGRLVFGWRPWEETPFC